MSYIEEFTLILEILKICGITILLYTFFKRLQNIEENTASINEKLEYIINRIEDAAANETINEIEEELESIK